MGRRNSPDRILRAMAWRAGYALMGGVAVAALAVLGLGSIAASAQSLTDALQGRPAASGQKDKMLVEAKELIYNRDNDTVTASGDVQIYYQGKVLQADKVIYDRKNKRLYAEGNAKLTEPDGSVSFGQRFTLSEDFRNGFVDALTARTKDYERITAPRAERANGNTMVFHDATYTACAPCADHPERPPLWQIRATRIIHNGQEQTIYYENATLELLGIPFAWLPFMSTPDSTVESRSGVLPPKFVYNSYLGYGVGIPIYWAMAPNYDLTITPTYLTEQGLLTQAEFRQRLMYGSYNIRAAGIFQQDPSVFPAPGNSSFRGSLQSTGEFYLSNKWSIGWDAALWSDKYFRGEYKIATDTVKPDFFQESISNAHLTGQGDRSYFDLRGYYIQGEQANDLQRQVTQPAPVIEYNKAFDLPKAQTYGIGGELSFDFNFANVEQPLASYQAVGNTPLNNPSVSPTTAPAQYAYCMNYVPGAATGSCLIRGIGGDYARASAQVSWRKNIYDDFGGLWQPFAFLKVNGSMASLGDSNADSLTFATPILNQQGQPVYSTISNANQSNWFGPGSTQSTATAMPGVGVEYRFPLVATTSWATHIFEPIAQVIVRPNETVSKSTINEDAQSLVVDDTNLFDWNKFSGYDRTEGGVRLNAGAQYTMNFSSGGYANALVGQSYQLAGTNSYSIADMSNTGLDSGLQNQRSYYITRMMLAPTQNYSFVTKANFDENTLALKRLDASASLNFGHLTASVLYSRYAAEPEIGFYTRREGLALNGRYNFAEHYYATGSITFDMSRYLLDTQLGTTTSRFSPVSYGLGVGYNDDCTTLSVNYNFGYQYGVGQLVQSQSVVAQLTLRTLGTLTANTALSANATSDAAPSAVDR